MIDLYRKVPVRTDMILDADMIGLFHALALEHNLSAYDAVYLELAQRRGLGLATMDRKLRLVAQQAGVRVALSG